MMAECNVEDEFPTVQRPLIVLSIDTYAGIANIMLSAYIISCFKEQFHKLGSEKKQFRVAILFAIASIIFSVLYGVCTSFLRLDFLTFQKNIFICNFSCTPRYCSICAVFDRLARTVLNLRYFCTYSVFLQSICINFQFVNIRSDEKWIKSLQLSTGFLALASSIMGAIFREPALFQLQNSHHYSCFQKFDTIATISSSILGTYWTILGIGLLIEFFRRARKVMIPHSFEKQQT